jgi:hypothetical protein
MRALERGLGEKDAVVGDDADRIAVNVREAGDQRLAVARLELVEFRPSTMRAMISRMSNGRRVSRRHDAVQRLGGDTRVRAARDVHRQSACAVELATMSRAIASACASFSAKWSATPEIDVCTSAPPSASASTTSPVAAFTSGGPPRKDRALFLDDDRSSLIAGTYAPPAVHEPMTTAI